MSEKQPTFRERIRLLEIASAEAPSIAELLFKDELGPRLQEVADCIDAEVERMKAANERFEARRVTAKPPNKRARPKASLQRARG